MYLPHVSKLLKLLIVIIGFSLVKYHMLIAQESLYPPGANINITYNISSTSFEINDTISVTRSITNNETYSLSNLYITENLPPEFQLIQQSLKINGIDVSFNRDGPTLGGELTGYNLYQWIIDYPGSTSPPNRLLAPGERLDLEYVIVVGSPGNYTLPFHTVCFYGGGGGHFATAGSIIDNTVLITASAAANGNISPSGSIEVARGQSQTFTITANTGYRISNVLVDGASVGAVSSYTFTNVNTNHTISASFVAGGTVYTITASAGANGAISPSGNVLVNQGASATFTIMPNSGYRISNVMVDGVSMGPVSSYTFTNVTANHSISATFTAGTTFTINATAGANGRITPSGNIIVNQGSNVSFSITPNAGYRVNSVLVDGVSIGAVTSYAFNNVNANHTISASFIAAGGTYSVYSAAGPHGTISPLGQTVVSGGANITYTITPNTGYRVSVVYVDGVSVGAISTYTFSNITSNHRIQAYFSVNVYTITSSAGTGGYISPSGSVSIAHGGSRTFQIVAASGYRISSVLVDGVSVGAVSSYTFSNVRANHTISASFTRNALARLDPERSREADSIPAQGAADGGVPEGITPDDCNFVNGDANGDGIVDPLDIVYAVSLLKNPDLLPAAGCGCVSDELRFPAADVDGNCAFNALDIAYYQAYLRGEGPAPIACPDCVDSSVETSGK